METLQRTANRGSISTGYDIDNSLKLEADNSEYLKANNTFAYTTPTSRYTGTVSFWIKRTEIGNNVSGKTMYIFASSDSSRYTNLGFDEFDNLTMYSGDSSWNGVSPYTYNKFRDTAAWYHIVIRYDTTDSTASNRLRVYCNGTEVNWAVAPNITQNGVMTISGMNGPCWHSWGTIYSYYTPSNFFNGYLAEAHFVDGQSLAPTEFGEYDSASGIWKPKEYDGTYGNCGYYLDFADSANLGDDESDNAFDFDENNITSADQATDTPTNNFTTWNTIRLFNSGVISFKEGGTVLSNSFNGGWSAANNNIRMGKGKWYAEFEVTVSGNYLMNGNVDADYIDNSTSAAFYLGSLTDKTAGAGYYSSGTTGNDTIYYEQTFTSSGVTTSAGDIISVAIDCDNNKVHFAVNGSWTNSSDPATNTNGFAMTDNEQYFALASIGVRDYKANFGGYTTSTISSPASDANGYGTFEYAPPSGYYALCGKNLAEYG